jgi:hypothetical protein
MEQASLAAGRTAEERAELLRRHQPYLLYDALEVYFADAADEWTRAPTNRLRRHDGKTVTIADGLSLDMLGPIYPDGVRADPADFIEAGRRDYDRQYADLRSHDQSLRNVIYGRAVDGPRGLWLQYWFWYFLNDYQLAFGIDVHEGDWEMVQIHVPAGATEPDTAVYAQHTYCQVQAWESVARLDAELPRQGKPPEPGAEHRPLVYVGRGSHASFFEPGYHETDFYDLCDGRQPPKTATRLVDVTDPPAWLRWPGHWGSTRLEYAGPSAPCAHRQWSEPEWLLSIARDVPERPAPGAPHIVARAHDERLLVDFDASACEHPPDRIVVTVNCSDDKTAPPRALRFDVADLLRGRLETRVAIDRRKHYDVRVASVDENGRPSWAHIFLFEPPNRLRSLLRRLSSLAGHLVYRFRRWFPIEAGRHSDAPLA